MKSSKTIAILIIMVLVALIAGACGPKPSESIWPENEYAPGVPLPPEPPVLTPQDFIIDANLWVEDHGIPTGLLPQECQESDQTVPLAGDERMIICGDYNQEDILEGVAIGAVALTITTLSPILGDEVVAAIVVSNEVKLLIVIAASVWLINYMASGVYAPVHSNPAHDPYTPGAWANVELNWFLANYAGIIASTRYGGPRCGAWVDANGKVKRWQWWIPVAETVGTLFWAYVTNGVASNWGGVYPRKLLSSLRESPLSHMYDNWTFKPCPKGQMPNPFDFTPPPAMP
ncbi:MAG: hypothetical protein Q8N16_01905 [bacterium]|nr:hypothetical protein [bacterium]